MWLEINMDIFVKALKVLFIVNLCQARVLSPKRTKLSIAEPMPYYYYNNIDGHPGTYAFGYDVSDPATGNIQFRTEERYPNGTVVGSYGHVDSLGKPHRYNYIADERGYRVMRDRPYKPYIEKPSENIISNAENIATESSITWTRPYRKKNKDNNLNRRRNNYV